MTITSVNAIKQEVLKLTATQYPQQWSNQLVSYVKQPPYIPYLELVSLAQVARFFNVTEGRVRNIYNSNMEYFSNDTKQITCKEIEGFAVMKKNRGKRWGCELTFSNGVNVQLPYHKSLVFNGRALLKFAVFLYDGSDTARRIVDLFWKSICVNFNVLSPSEILSLY